MIERVPPYILKKAELTKEEREELELSQWAFQSHYWLEDPAGYFRCKWCGMYHASNQALQKGFPLCRENPYIKNLILQVRRGGGE